MGAFEYSALNDKGKELKGVLEGDTARQVRQQLREKGWIPLSVDEVAERQQKGARRVGLGNNLKPSELALVTRQLATLIGAGQPLEEALRAVSQQSEKARVRNMLTAVRSKVMEGHTLAEGFAQFPRAFPELFRATVAAGEQTGHLEIVLERLADYTESRHYMRQKIQQAMFYPAGLVLVATGVVVLLLTYVVPQVTQVFSDMNQELPPLTRGLIALSDFLRHYGIVLLIGLVILVIAFIYGLKNENFRYGVHTILLRIPLVQRLIRGANAGRFARTFSILTASGVNVLEALRISAEVISNLPMRQAVEEAAGKIREGTGISKALERSRQFPPMLLHLIASGEGTGRLEQMLERGAIHQEREVEGIIGTMLGIMEPALIVAMGGIVMLIVMAILLPIFELNQLVH